MTQRWLPRLWRQPWSLGWRREWVLMWGRDAQGGGLEKICVGEVASDIRVDPDQDSSRLPAAGQGYQVASGTAAEDMQKKSAKSTWWQKGKMPFNQVHRGRERQNELENWVLVCSFSNFASAWMLGSDHCLIPFRLSGPTHLVYIRYIINRKLYTIFCDNLYGKGIRKRMNIWVYKIESLYCTPGEGNGTPLQYSCLENPTDRGAWWAAVHGVTKSRTPLSDFTFTFTFHFHALEKEMAAHSSVLAWRILGKEEPSGLPSMGSHRVRHDWSDIAAAAALYTWN